MSFESKLVNFNLYFITKGKHFFIIEEDFNIYINNNIIINNIYILLIIKLYIELTYYF